MVASLVALLDRDEGADRELVAWTGSTGAGYLSDRYEAVTDAYPVLYRAPTASATTYNLQPEDFALVEHLHAGASGQGSPTGSR
ncbi:hypothetical protein ACFUMH_04130 [Cellulomonas sp. NPDC057328]|uniref:hypothetical protein n=1 Tax=Cellulomonas sp. NPDC057328 TaxID=3346101 RepID=UPI00362F4083